MPRLKSFYTPEQIKKTLTFTKLSRNTNLALLAAAEAAGVAADAAYIKEDMRFGGKLVSVRFGNGKQVHPVHLKLAKVRDRTVVKATFNGLEAKASAAIKDAFFGNNIIVEADGSGGKFKVLTSLDVSGQNEEDLAAATISYCQKVIQTAAKA